MLAWPMVFPFFSPFSFLGVPRRGKTRREEMKHNVKTFDFGGRDRWARQQREDNTIRLGSLHTMTLPNTDSKNSSSSANAVKISPSLEILIKMVNACCAIGYSSPKPHMGAQSQYHPFHLNKIQLKFHIGSS